MAACGFPFERYICSSLHPTHRMLLRGLQMLLENRFFGTIFFSVNSLYCNKQKAVTGDERRVK
jgi:hypothetical protein